MRLFFIAFCATLGGWIAKVWFTTPQEFFLPIFTGILIGALVGFALTGKGGSSSDSSFDFGGDD